MLKNDPDLTALQESPWFSARSRAFQQALTDCAVRRSYDEDEALYLQGDAANGIHAVLEGSVRITVPADDGQEFVIHQEGRGFWIGDLALFATNYRLVSVVAIGSTDTLFFPASRLDRMVQKTPEFLRDFYALTHENMQKALRIIANLAVTGTEKRLALRLLHLDEVSTDAEGWIPVSQEELAAMIAVSPPTLHRALHRLIEPGMIEGGYGRLRLQDRRALIALCQS
ncbi:putative cAMP-binding protein - catabolite gene activator and regulatory subunit of cAMP-dependent protein kinase [Rhodobacteraceae bacterium KLH11]|nr:putative cAMP-binding protein - catabolite gene activator and regulatory subunit of cAMP-dependent protein kinase [Rhodobacteraceae bacterium KLH11]